MKRTAFSLACIAAGTAALTAQSPPRATSGLTAVEGLKVGHHTLAERPTGCTVILVDGDAVGSVSQRGGAPGTRETDLLNPLNMVDKVNAIVLAGGSAFGLEAATGTVRWLEEHDIGWPAGAAKVPIVPAAILFDLGVGGNAKVRPTAECGYKAAAAASAGPIQEGSVGAGAGATVGKLGGANRSTKSGLGTASISLPTGLVVAAIVAVNAVGDIIDPSSGKVVAGVRNPDGTFADARKILRSGATLQRPRAGENTTIGLVATNAKMTKALVARMALMADDGYARAISPSHTTGDGDTIFSLATGRWDGNADITTIGALAAEAMADAVVRAATQATGAAGIPAARDLKR
ncbi:MAG TPA: P1 family peptidase [Vicinamibacterales bacterium]|nr:P1 family peptidase [Vicinamibacterales bacterium]